MRGGGDLMKKSFAAAESLGARRILVTGGVAANRRIARALQRRGCAAGVRVDFPTLVMSTDNAAMMLPRRGRRFLAGEFAARTLSADPLMALGGESPAELLAPSLSVSESRAGTIKKTGNGKSTNFKCA